MVEKMITKAVQLGLGVMDVTKEQVEKFVKEVTKNNKTNVAEGRKMVDKILKDAKVAKDKLEKKIDAQVKKIIEKSNLATKKDLKDLEQKLKPSKAKTTKKK